MKSTFRYFWGSFAALFAGVAFGYTYLGATIAWDIFVLAVLETSLSFDNAVMNATVLGGWNSTWRRAFLLFGLPVAVFGMRLAFPVLIVSTTTGISMYNAMMLALYEPARYATALTAVHHQVAYFGGAFLLMVAFEYFLDEEKEEHWVPFIEPFLAKLGTYQKMVGAGIALSIVMFASRYLDGSLRGEAVAAGVFGVITYVTVKFLGEMISGGDGDVGKKVAQGIGGLLYLEILDASMSFDGVIGAFAVTNKIVVIMIGLGIGAWFVRSLTIYLVDKGTLSQYRYLEHGAFWAILALALTMFIGVKIDIPETVSGLIGAAFIGISFFHSYIANNRDAANTAP